MEKRHMKRMKRFKEQVSGKRADIEDLTDLGTRFIKKRDFEKENIRKPEPQRDDGGINTDLDDLQSSQRKNMIKHHLNKFLVARNYDPLYD